MALLNGASICIVVFKWEERGGHTWEPGHLPNLAQRWRLSWVSARVQELLGSWLTSLLDQQLAVVNSALVDSVLEQINGFLFNWLGTGVVLGAVTEAKWHLLSLIVQSLLLIDRLKLFKIDGSKIVRRGPGQAYLSIKGTALTKYCVISFLYHFRPCQ